MNLPNAFYPFRINFASAQMFITSCKIISLLCKFKMKYYHSFLLIMEEKIPPSKVHLEAVEGFECRTKNRNPRLSPTLCCFSTQNFLGLGCWSLWIHNCPRNEFGWISTLLAFCCNHSAFPDSCSRLEIQLLIIFIILLTWFFF